MPKGLTSINSERKCKNEKFELIITSEKAISKEIITRENNYINKASNEFFYSTPISFEKRNYIPSTPKKIVKKENDDFVVMGKDLSKLFESL